MSNPALARPSPSSVPVAPVTNAEKARALIAMLEPGQGTPSDVPPDRLRAWASDLIRTVEGDSAPKTPAEPQRRRRLFTKAPPTLTPEPAARPKPQPSRLTLTAPEPHRLETASPTGPALDATLPGADIRKIVDATVDPATLAREHPAIIAMTLMGKATMDQAGALRSLPGGQVRAVHKALRLLEETGRIPAPGS